MELIFRPIEKWPGKLTANKKRSLFSAGYSKTLRLLDAELAHLGAKAVVLQVALSQDDIRLDGCPRAGSTATHPGVILSFESKFGPLSYPCDEFDKWEDNLRAIALSLEHLRTVDRYGVTKRGEQYKGWNALPPPAHHSMTRPDAVKYFASIGFLDVSNEAKAREAFRQASLRFHPDRGGDAEQFKRAVKAMEALGYN
jgi:hypothetical protein